MTVNVGAAIILAIFAGLWTSAAIVAWLLTRHLPDRLLVWRFRLSSIGFSLAWVGLIPLFAINTNKARSAGAVIVCVAGALFVLGVVLDQVLCLRLLFARLRLWITHRGRPELRK